MPCPYSKLSDRAFGLFVSVCLAWTRTSSPVKIGLRMIHTTANNNTVVARLKNDITSVLGKPEIWSKSRVS